MRLKEGDKIRIGDKYFITVEIDGEYARIDEKEDDCYDYDLTQKMMTNNLMFDFYYYVDNKIKLVQDYNIKYRDEINFINTNGSIYIKILDEPNWEVIEDFVRRYPEYTPCCYMLPPK